MTDTIRVTRTTQGYMADFSNASNADEVIGLFGTYTLPTAFTAHAQADLVRVTIEQLNPGNIVIMS